MVTPPRGRPPPPLFCGHHTHPTVSHINSLIHKVDTNIRESAQSKSDVRLFMANLLWSRVNEGVGP